MKDFRGQQPASNQVPPRITPASEVPQAHAPHGVEHEQPRFITVKALQGAAAKVIQELSAANESAIIVRHGKLLATLSPISGDDVLHEAFGRLAQQLPDAEKIAAEVHAGELYHHFKGGTYRIVKARAQSSESAEEFVIYEDCVSGEVWIRPSAMFAQLVEVDGAMVPRFKRISDDSVDGFCTCDGDSGSGRMRDCGIAAHREEAVRERRFPSQG